VSNLDLIGIIPDGSFRKICGGKKEHTIKLQQFSFLENMSCCLCRLHRKLWYFMYECKISKW